MLNYKVVCDETNNSPEDIKKNICNVDIYLRPADHIEMVLTIKDPHPVADSVKKVIEKMMLQRVDDWALGQIMMRGWFPTPPPIEPPYKKMLRFQF